MTESTPHVELTQAERDVLVRLIDGAAVQEVARERATSAYTIRGQIASIHRKLDLQSTSLAMVWGAEHRRCCLRLPWERPDTTPAGESRSQD